MDKALRILLLEDVIYDYELIKQELDNSDINYTSKLVSDEKNFLKEIKDFQPDIILSDYSLPQYDGMSALMHTLKVAPEIPFIIVTGSINEEIAVDCIKAGATDYVTKEHLPRLIHAIKGAIKQSESARERKRAEDTKEVLMKISELSETSESLEVLSKIIHKELGRIIDNRNFYIAIYNPEKEVYNFVFIKDKSSNYNPEDEYDLTHSLTDFVRKSNVAIRVNEKIESELKKEYTIKRFGLPAKVWAGAPLIDSTTNTTIGVVSIQNFEDENAISDKDVELLEFVARNIGTLIARKKAAISITESEEQFRSLAQTASDAIIIINDEGQIIFWNEAATNIFQYKKSEAVGKYLHDVITPSQYHELIYNGLLDFKQTGEGSIFGKTHELIGKRKDGSVFPVELAVSKFKRGGRWHATGFIRDITKRKEAEFELKKALEKAEESDRLKTAFLANMSHEIRTPMNAILGFSELLTMPDITGKESEEFVKLIQGNSNSLLNLINDIIDIAKIEAEQLKIYKSDFSLNKLIDDLYHIHKEKKKEEIKSYVSINKNIPDNTDDLIIVSDINRINQVLTNLLNNAVKYTHEGIIDFGYELKKLGGTPIIEFFVKDTGIGIPTDKLEIIFERFRQGDDSYTKEYGGTGLGLAISKNIANLLDGDIKVESEEGKGSSFYFYIPLEKSKLEIKRQTDYLPKKDVDIIDLSGKTILIAEDVESNYQLLESYLLKTKANIIWVENGKEAIETCNKDIKIDLILMDMQMPVLNGYEATKRIKEQYPEIPIIAETAFALAGDREKILMAGCSDYISKPIRANKLYKKLEKYI